MSKITGDTSDGYHTFNELYEFRLLYNAALFNELYNTHNYGVHKSKLHSDRKLPFGGGWFVVSAELPTGQITNHYELKDWDLFAIEERTTAVEWDGHTAADVAERLRKFVELQANAKPLRELAQSNSKSEDTSVDDEIQFTKLDGEVQSILYKGVYYYSDEFNKSRDIVKTVLSEPPQDSPLGQVTSLDDIRKCFRDTYMQTEGDTELFDTEETIKAISAWHKAEIAKLFEQIRSELDKPPLNHSYPEKSEVLEALTRLEEL